MSAHAPIAPSALHRLLQCPASLRMQAAFPEDANSDRAKAAAEGTAAHEAMAILHAGGSVTPGQRASNGVPFDHDMIAAARMILNDAHDTAQRFGMTLADTVCEKPVAIHRIHPLCWGTPDLRLYVPNLKLFIVWDLKYGHRYVSEFENPQTTAYGIGCVAEAGVHDLHAVLDLRIVQPRAYGRGGPVRSWKVNASDVRGQVNLMNAAATEALNPASKARSGVECLDCSARHACEVFQRSAQAAMEYSGSPVPHELSDDALATELALSRMTLGMLQARTEALEEQAKHRIRSGKRLRGWSIQSAPGRAAWTVPADQVAALGQMLQIKLMSEPAPITPNQAIEAGVPAAVVAAMSERKPGAAKLSFDDGTEARRIFSI